MLLLSYSEMLSYYDLVKVWNFGDLYKYRLVFRFSQLHTPILVPPGCIQEIAGSWKTVIRCRCLQRDSFGLWSARRNLGYATRTAYTCRWFIRWLCWFRASDLFTLLKTSNRKSYQPADPFQTLTDIIAASD